jgi:hypothetical protein
MKKLTTLALLACAFAGTNVQAQTSPLKADFYVNLTLTPKCIIANLASDTTSATAVPDINLSYTAFGAAVDGGNTFMVRCSSKLSYGVAIDKTAETDDTSGLNYKLTLTKTATDLGSLQNQTLASQVGSAAGTNYYVNVNVPAGQAGSSTPLTGTPNNKRTVTVTF